MKKSLFICMLIIFGCTKTISLTESDLKESDLQLYMLNIGPIAIPDFFKKKLLKELGGKYRHLIEKDKEVEGSVSTANIIFSKNRDLKFSLYYDDENIDIIHFVKNNAINEDLFEKTKNNKIALPAYSVALVYKEYEIFFNSDSAKELILLHYYLKNRIGETQYPKDLESGKKHKDLAAEFFNALEKFCEKK